MTVILLIVSMILCAIPFVSVADDPAQSPVNDTVSVSSHATNILLSAGKDPTSYNIRWNSSAQGVQSVQWCKSESIVDGVFPADASVDEAEKEGSVARAFIDSLEENTSYSYRVGSEKIGWSEAYSFKTGDFDDNEFSFLFISDPQLGVNGAAYDAQTWNTSLEKARAWFGDEIEFMLSAGDQVDDADKPEQFDAFASPALLRSLPIMTTVGNHDNGAASYSDHFVQSDVDESTTSVAGKYSGDYWVTYDGVLIMNLNTNVLSRSLHEDFMKKAVEEYTAEYGEPSWKIVVFHHSLYSAALDRIEDGEYRRERLVPLMSEMGIDAVLMGHDHIYTRTYMMNGLTPIDDASRYVKVANDPYGSYYDPAEGEVFYLTVNTAASSKFYTITEGMEPYAAFKNQESISIITKIDVTEDSLQFTTYRSMENNEIGDVLDFFAIHKTTDAGEDTHAPVLNVPSEAYNFSNAPLKFLEGVRAYDNLNGDLTEKISFSGIFSAPGSPSEPISTITCSVTDDAGNTATKTIDVTAVTAQEIITPDFEWKYLDEGNYPFDVNDENKTEWTTEAYDDSAWKTGVGSFGSIDDQLADHNGVTPDTLLPAYFPEGSDEEGSLIPNFFFRSTFDLEDSENVDILTADLWYDDAVLVYINGVLLKEIFADSRYTMGYSIVDRDGPSTYGSFRITDPDLIASLNLKKTGNIIAIELYQGHNESNDIFFNLESFVAGSLYTPVELPFTDVNPTRWYFNDIVKAYSMGLFAGVTETTFEPKSTMTRAMVWTVLAKMSDVDLSGGEKWYSKAQEWAMENGVSDGTNPKNNITRQEIVTMLHSLSGKPAVSGNLDSFTDKNSASSWAIDALVWAVEKGVMTGRGEGILDPRTDLTRAEACTVILSYIDIK